MKKIILSESQSKRLAEILKEGEVQQMPIDKKMNKPYYINPEKVKVVKKYLDNGFTAHDYEKVGEDGYPCKIKIISMNASNGTPLKLMYKDQLKDLLIDKFQKMFLDKMEREMFMTQVLDDWLNGSIGVHGTLSKNMLKEMTVTSDMVDERASETNLDPTEGQKEAGNYKMGHISIKGMKISIENPKDSVRKGTDKDGTPWERVMKNHYGYFTNTTGNGKDGDAVDVFIGPHPDNFTKVYVIDQKVDGEFDESKVMLGFYSKQEAINAYKSNYDADWQGLWKVTGVPIRVFKRWLYRDHKQRKPFFDYVTIKKHKIEEGQINEEEYNEIKYIGNLFDQQSAFDVTEELRAKGIECFTRGSKLYIMIERDRNCPAYVDEMVDYAKRILHEYLITHSDSMAAAALREGAIGPQDMFDNMMTNPEPKEKREEPPFDGWKRVSTIKDGKKMMNLKNTETGELISENWFDWVGYLVNGFAIVRIRELGYNIINEHGEIMLPSWHEDIQEPDENGQYTLIDGRKTETISL